MKTAIDFETDVLVVGSGPTGATAALALATCGVRVHLASKWNWLASTPRAHITNTRTVEVLRDLGVEAEARKHATPWASMGETLWTTSFAGPEIARLRTWGTGEERIGDYLQQSPCTMLDLPQTFMEPVLIHEAASRGASIAMNTEYLSHEQDARGVTVALRDRLSGRDYAVRAKYLFGADGARSKVVEDIGLELEGHVARAGTHYTLFKADLSRFVAHRPSILYWIVTPDASFGEIGQGLLRAIKPWGQWIAGWGFDKDAGEPQYTEAELERRIRILIGDDSVPIEIESRMVWYVNQQYATTYSKGRVFCGGDAVHRHPPSSGLGSNTCIQDAFNLAWKLALVLDGTAPESLLDTYEPERRPHVQAFIELAVRLGAVIQATDPAVAAERAARFLAGEAQVFEYPQPGLGPGRHAGALGGTLFPQPRLADGRRLDEALGDAFAVLGDAAAIDAADAATRERWRAAGAVVLRDPGEAVAAWWRTRGLTSVVLRPDRYLLGAARDAHELAAVSAMIA
jgi:2,4-dichlorophenol 6-monooxygenase